MKTTLALALVAATASFASAGPKDNTWTQLKDAKWQPVDPADKTGKGPQISLVFGNLQKGPAGFLFKVPAGFKPGAHTHTSDDYAVVIQGTLHNFKAPGKDTGPGLTVGGSWFQPGGQPHDNECEASSKDGCILFIYVEKGFDFKPWPDPKAAPAK